jgi:enoyl-CoA hydratase
MSMSKVSETLLECDLSGGVLTLTLNQPSRANALSAALVEALIEQISIAFSNPAVTQLQFKGEGKHFCSGLDLSNLATSSDGDLLHRLVRIETLLSLVWQSPIPTCAIVQGRTWGAGADLMVACERRIAFDDTTFRFPGAQFGIALGTRRLAERVGGDAARGLILHSLQWNVQQALLANLITQVCDANTSAQLGVAQGIAINPSISDSTARTIRRATQNDRSDEDLATLVRSAALPGLKSRIEAYRAALKSSQGQV